MPISQSIERACRRYEEVQAEGLTLYPILVEEMETFELARPGIDIVQQSLPVAYAVMPLLAAYYKMEYDAMGRGEETVGLLSRALLMLALSLRLGRGKPLDERLKAFRCKVDTKDPSRLTAVEFVLHGEELWRITPAQFQYLGEFRRCGFQQFLLGFLVQGVHLKAVFCEPLLHLLDGVRVFQCGKLPHLCGEFFSGTIMQTKNIFTDIF